MVDPSAAPSWLWGRNPVFGAGNLTAAGVLENVLDPEKVSPLSTAPLLAAARRHPPPDAWVPVVALAAHQARDEALLAAMAARVWTETSWATLRSVAPARAEAVSAVEAAVAAHRLATELDAPGSDRPRLRL